MSQRCIFEKCKQFKALRDKSETVTGGVTENRMNRGSGRFCA
jgi:hypothetical protein